MSDLVLLPAGFAALEEFVAYWDRPSTQERWEQRAAASMQQIQRFYDCMLAHAPAAMDHIRGFPIDSMPEPTGRLARLCLALANVSIAVEMLRQPRVANSPYPHAVKLVRGPAYWG